MRITAVQTAFPIKAPGTGIPSSSFDGKVFDAELSDLGVTLHGKGFKPQPGQPDEFFIPWSNVRAIYQMSDKLLAAQKVAEQSKTPELSPKVPTRVA
jgi:hypothetical protein